MDRGLYGDGAGVTDTRTDSLCEMEMMAVAVGKFAVCLRDADNPTPRLKFVAGQPEIQVALEIERRHARVARVVEPEAATQFGALVWVAHRATPFFTPGW